MNNSEENSRLHQSKLDLRICGGEHKVSTLEEVQAVSYSRSGVSEKTLTRTALIPFLIVLSGITF